MSNHESLGKKVSNLALYADKMTNLCGSVIATMSLECNRESMLNNSIDKELTQKLFDIIDRDKLTFERICDEFR